MVGCRLITAQDRSISVLPVAIFCVSYFQSRTMAQTGKTMVIQIYSSGDQASVPLTRKVETLAMSLPQVSAMISSVSAFVPVSIPLFTNMSKGRFAPSRLGRNFVSSTLGQVVHMGYY
jgi:hypothetical protein